MACPTERHRVVVLRKTKTGETDLILRCLAENGELLEAVARGARKPQSPFASRLELYGCADILVAKGRGLPVITEARCVEGFAGLRTSLEKSLVAAPCAELLTRIAQPGLTHERLFALTTAAFQALEKTEGPRLLAIGAAHMLKAMAMVGFLPSFTECACCGAPLGDESPCWFSHLEGGRVCAACRTQAQAVAVEPAVLLWARALLGARFADISGMDIPERAALEVLRFDQAWVRTHADCRLKSLEFLFSSGLLGLGALEEASPATEQSAANAESSPRDD